MPTQRDLKRLVRRRMTKTGESYTTARLQLLKKKAEPTRMPADYLSLAGMSDEAVRAKTGRTWPEWVRALDALDAARMPHREIARLLHDQHGVPDWWCQTVTVGYERIRGLRDVGQRRGGSYEASKSKTFPVPVAKLYAAFATLRARKRWLGDVRLTVRTATPSKSMRITWDDETSVHLYFEDRGPAKSRVAVQHVGLADKADALSRKGFWAERLDALGRSLG